MKILRIRVSSPLPASPFFCRAANRDMSWRTSRIGTAHQEYVLTAKGESLFPIVAALRQWGEKHLFQRGEHDSVLIDKRNGKPIPRMEPLSKDGAALPPSATLVRRLPGDEREGR